MASDLYTVYGIYVVAAGPIASKTDGKPLYFLRLSANVYNEMKDFERVAKLVPQLLDSFATSSSSSYSEKPFDFIHP
jgi:hypothetical protein